MQMLFTQYCYIKLYLARILLKINSLYIIKDVGVLKMIQTARLLRWTNSSMSFWKRTNTITPREIQFSLLSANNSTRSCSQKYLDQIDKLTYDYAPKKVSRGKFQQVLSCYSQWMQKQLGLIDVQSNWLLIWNIINYFGMRVIHIELLFILLNDTVLSIQKETVGFDPVTKYLLFVVFIIDMVLVRYRIPIFIKGKFIKDPDQLLIRYLKGYIIIDLLTIILLLIVIDEVWQWQYIKILMFLKYKTGLLIDEQINYKLISYRVLMVIYSFLKFILSLIFWTILYACIYLIIDFHYVNEQGQYYQMGMVWLTSSPSISNTNLCEQFSWIVWFEYSLFFILETMRGCGYGQVTPRNPPQILFANLSMLTLMAFFAHFTKQIIDISVSYSIQKEQLLVETTSNLRSMQESYGISEINTIKYLQQITRKYKKEQLIIEHLAQCHFSDDLKYKFSYQFRIFFILASRFLYEISNDDQGVTFKMELSQVIQSKKSFKGEYFYQKGMISQQVLYLSEQGRIKVENYQLKIVHKTHNWDFVGVRQFFIDKKSIFDVISLATLKIYYLKKSQFVKILKKYRSIYQRYCEELDSIKFNSRNTQKLSLICLYCKNYHLFEQCMLFRRYKDYILMLKERLQEKTYCDQVSVRSPYRRSKIVSEKVRCRMQIDDKNCYYLSSEYFTFYNI